MKTVDENEEGIYTVKEIRSTLAMCRVFVAEMEGYLKKMDVLKIESLTVEGGGAFKRAKTELNRCCKAVREAHINAIGQQDTTSLHGLDCCNDDGADLVTVGHGSGSVVTENKDLDTQTVTTTSSTFRGNTKRK